MKGKRRRRPGLSARQRAWVNSPRWKRVREGAAKKARAKLKHGPHCGAKRKQDGLPCQMPALENGRCRLHGGLTPRGDQWHRVQFPGPNAPPEKLDKKLRELDRRRQRRKARAAGMTAEERVAYEKHSRAVRPRRAVDREMERRDREMWRMLSRPGPPAAPDPRMSALKAQAELLRVERERLEALLLEQERKQEKSDE